MKKLSIISIAALSIFALASFTSAATIDQLQPAAITYNEDLTVNGTGRFNSVYIGSTTGEGGVTFFNGTMINNSQGDVPLTMGDDLRVDGMIWRGSSKGTSDNMPLKIADSMVPALNNANDFGSSSLQWKDGYFACDVRVGNLLGSGVVGYNNLDTSNSAAANQVLSYNGSNLKWINSNSGDITAVNAGTGLAGGGNNGAVALRVATNSITTNMITDGTITGSDINSTSNISVSTGNFSNNVTIGNSNATSINWHWSGSGTMSGGIINSNTCSNHSLTLSGSLPENLDENTDNVLVSPTSGGLNNVYTYNLSWNSYIDSAGDTYIHLCNPTGGNIILVAGLNMTFKVDIWGH